MDRCEAYLGLVALLVGDGAAAVAAVETHRDDLVCAVLDVVMPVMSGPDAAQAIQHIAPDLAIVLMSGAVPLHYADQIARLRLAGRLNKPFPLAALRDMIRYATAASGSFDTHIGFCGDHPHPLRQAQDKLRYGCGLLSVLDRGSKECRYP